MYSFFSGDPETLGYKGQYHSGEYWQDYLAYTFDRLPGKNRYTNKGRSRVMYTAHYNSQKSIDFDVFSADVEVLLVNSQGENITHKGHFDFHGQKKM